MSEAPDWEVQASTTIRRTLELFGPSGCCLSFNGGKDATVIFHLIREVLLERFREVTLVYFEVVDEFPEVLTFLDEVSALYGVTIHRLSGKFTECLNRVIQEHGAKSIFMGTRKDDPYADRLATLTYTDMGWPNCIRVNPILHWEYKHVWEYLRAAQLQAERKDGGPVINNRSYCHLYDRGYTSLGSRKNTVPNPALLLREGHYGPAYSLQDGSTERGGRTPSKSSERTRPQSEPHTKSPKSNSTHPLPNMLKPTPDSPTPNQPTTSAWASLAVGIALGVVIGRHLNLGQ